MSSVIVNDERYPVSPGETVLDALLAAGVEISFGCRAGACQSCLLRASAGNVPAEAQRGLKETLKADGWFLPCRCQPDEELILDLDAESNLRLPARVAEKRLLAPRVMGLWLEPEQPFDYRPGQYITLWRDQKVGRSYSLASLPRDRADRLELHVSRIDGGAVSTWVHDHLQAGDRVDIHGPMGECFYVAGEPERPLLLVGTGTGLAPVYGVLKDALCNGHDGPIHLFHGARTSDYLYYHEELTSLVEEHDNLHYHPCLVLPSGQLTGDVQTGPVDQAVAQQVPLLAGWRVYLSGAPDIVGDLRRKCFLAGAASRDIHTDPFV